MPESDNAALADTEHNGPAANTYSRYGILGQRTQHFLGRLRIDLGYAELLEAVPSYPSRCRATRIVPVIVGPEPFPLLGRRVLSQCRMRRFIEHARRRIARNKIHPSTPRIPCVTSRSLRECERYTMSWPRKQRLVTV
jgi:hypothetical protein